MFLCLSFVASLVIHSVTWLSHWKSRTSPNSIPNPIHLFCTSHSLNTTYFQKFRLVSSMIYLKFQIVCMQKRGELRALKSCQERKKIWEKYEYGKERKEERRKKIYEKEKEEKEKEKDEVAIKIWEGWIKWKKGKIKCKEGCHVDCETKLLLYFQPCAIRQRGRHRCLVVTIFFCPCTCPPF
jgi:putative cell wall-binding protein